MTEDDYYPPDATTHVSLSPSASAGLASLIIGCTLLVAACIMMAFNVILFTRGLRGIPYGLALFAAVLGVVSVAAVGVVAVALGLRGWGFATRTRESAALTVAGSAAAAGGLIGWLIAGINLLIILLS
jgi:hypothetical protein